MERITSSSGVSLANSVSNKELSSQGDLVPETNFNAPALKGSILDMWQWYQHLSNTDPEQLSDLSFFDTLTARDGMLFPDFFGAVNKFLHPSFFHATRLNRWEPYQPDKVNRLKTELDETFRTMESKWTSYEPFFKRHPELKYLRELSFTAFENREFSEKLPFLRGEDTSSLWSIVEYHKLRGDIDSYIALDEAILKNQNVRTLFEEERASCPGDFMIYLLPYGESAGKITPYLSLLKHGDLIGFGTIALARANGQQFVAITSLQTDLLRKDYIVEAASEARFTQSKIEENSDGGYTVPAKIRRRYLAKYDWARNLISTVENAVLEVSKKVPISGVIMPTLSSCGTFDFECISSSEYINRLYELFPGEYGYHKQEFRPVFPLTDHWERGAVFGSGEWWVKSIDGIKA